MSGGELLDVLDMLGLLNWTQAQFYTASILLALEFLHARRIAYLDLKSENCLIDQQGYVKIIDFGIAQRITSARCHVVKGTPMFMAPEMIKAQGYSTSADLWSLGICLYEFVVGEFPFANNSTNHAQIFQEILRAELRFPSWFVQQPNAKEMMSLIRGLLTRNPAKRKGAGLEGYQLLREDDFFKGLDWDVLLGRELAEAQIPYIPNKETYAEDKEEGGGSPSSVGANNMLPLVEDVEANDHEDEDWEDPNPGWDDCF